jgi:pilus assembly protein CpaC
MLVLCLLVVAAALAGRAAGALPRELRVAVSAAQVIEFPGPARSVFIADPTIADIQVSAPTSVIIFGRKPGQTTLIAIGADDKPIANIKIIVGYDYADLRRLIDQDVPNANVKITQTPSGITLTGVVPNDDTAAKVRASAQRYLSEKDTLINNLKVAGPAQINLRLRVAEVSRSVTKQLGFNWDAVASTGSFAFGLAAGRNLIATNATTTSTAVSQSVTNILSLPGAVANLNNRATPLSGITQSTAPDSFFGSLNTRRASVNSLIDALAEEGVVTILAQPNLTAESGQKASFIAGGEFPIPVAQTAATAGAASTITIEFKEFGVKLDFVPTVLSSDRISIQVRPEVSELSTNGAITISGLVIPALSVRRAETTVQLGSGESFAIAGLIRADNATDINKYPGLGDLPVLGPLFRSSSFQHNETELVIIVTPYVVRPTGEGPSLKLPTDGFAPASDIERIFLDRLTKLPTRGAANPIGPNGVRLRGDAGFVYQ